jgi:hypothetical protein
MIRDEATRRLWEAATYLWDEDEEMWDSATAYPGDPIKGKELWSIGVALGFIGEDHPVFGLFDEGGQDA